MQKKKIFPIAVLVATFAVYFSFGISGISKFVTTDEQFWHYTRIPQYWNAVKEGKFKQTRINDKPGVSLALVSGPAFFWADPDSQRIKDDKVLDSYRLENNGKFYAAFRLPLLFANALLLLYLFWVIRKISNEWAALWSTAFIGLSPVLLGISRISNPDALLWSFSAAAIFSYFALLKTSERKFIFLTALFTGFALLSKYVANILFIYFFISLFSYAAFKSGKDFDLIDFLKKQIKNFFLVFAGALAFFSVFMPAVFLKPKHLYAGTIGFSGIRPFVLPISFFFLVVLADLYFQKGKFSALIFSWANKYKAWILRMALIPAFFLFSFTAANWISGSKMMPLGHIPIDARSSDAFVAGTSLLEKAVLEAYPFVFSLTPLVLILMLALFLRSILKKSDADADFFYFSISSFILIFLIGGIFSDLLLTPRYMVMLLPLAGFLASLVMYQFCEKYIRKGILAAGIISVFVLLSGIISLWNIKPFYYNYASSLLPQKYVLSNAWGFGGYEASQYLNGLPDKDKITVWSDYRGVCEFSRFRCIIARKYDKERYPVDYYVLTRRGQSRTNDALLKKFENAGISPEWELFIDGRPGNFVKVYKSL